MKPIRVKIEKIRNRFYVRLPKLITDIFKYNEGDEIEIAIHPLSPIIQEDLWEQSPGDIDSISITLRERLHSLNMYNRIYVPVKYRFFFPPTDINFILKSNIGNIRTHLTNDGFIQKNMARWFSANGPLQTEKEIVFSLLSDNTNVYEVNYVKSKTDINKKTEKKRVEKTTS